MTSASLKLTCLVFSFQGDNDKKNFERLIEAVKESRKGKTVGVFTKDAKLSGQFLVSFHFSRPHKEILVRPAMFGNCPKAIPKQSRL